MERNESCMIIFSFASVIAIISDLLKDRTDEGIFLVVKAKEVK